MDIKKHGENKWCNSHVVKIFWWLIWIFKLVHNKTWFNRCSKRYRALTRVDIHFNQDDNLTAVIIYQTFGWLSRYKYFGFRALSSSKMHINWHIATIYVKRYPHWEVNVSIMMYLPIQLFITGDCCWYLVSNPWF